jgi:hypothetical protein
MAVKPNVADARWATDETNNDAPSSGQRDTGWTPGQIAVSDYFNVLGLEAYKWFLWLSDGDVDFNDVQVNGTLTVDGAFTVNDDLEVTGEIYYGSTTIFIPATLGQEDTDTPQASGGPQYSDAAGDSCWANDDANPLTLDIPISPWVPAGAILEAVTVHGRSGNAGGEIFSALLRFVAWDGTGTATIDSENSGTNNGVDTIELDGSLPYTVPAEPGHLVCRVGLDPSSAAGEVKVFGLEVTFSRPKP